MPRFVALFAAVLALLVAACGGSDNADTPKDPVQNVPEESGVREKVEIAVNPDETEFPATDGKSLEDLANEMTAGLQLALATSIYTGGMRVRLPY